MKAKWIEALRSDEHRKCTSFMKVGERLCALGVLCQTYLNETGKGTWVKHGTLDGLPIMSFATKGEVGVKHPPPDVLEWAGIDILLARVVASLNDRGAGFSVIANMLEQDEIHPIQPYWENLP